MRLYGIKGHENKLKHFPIHNWKRKNRASSAVSRGTLLGLCITWSNRGNLIYDPFMGSGTVAKICIATDRDYIGSEISEGYCDLIAKRLNI